MAPHIIEAVQVHYSFKPGPYSSHTILLDSFPLSGQGARVLDLGCADGQIGALLAARGFAVTGVERPGGAGEAFPASVNLVVANLDDGLPPLAGRFDFVLCADILEHLKDPAALLRAIPAIMSASGVLVASLPNSGNLYFRLNILFGRFPRHDKGLFDRTHLHFFMLDGWAELLAQSGFRMERVMPTGIPVALGMPELAGTPLVKMAEWVCYRLARLWKRLFAYQFVVTASTREVQGDRA